MPRFSPRWIFTLRVGLIFCLAVFYFATLRAGHEWGDDFAMYIRHAQNLVTGRAYADTGYIYNPAYPELSPRAYPPVLPVLLAPAVAVFGLNLTLLKLIPIFTLLIALCVIERALRSTLPWPARLAVVALTGFNPFFWEYKDIIASGFPFLMFMALGLWLSQRAYRQSGPVGWRAPICIGLAFYLAYGTRSIGVVFIPALWLYEIFFAQSRRVAWPVTLLFVALAAVQAWLIPGGSSYFDQLHITAPGTIDNVISLTKALAGFMDNGYSQAIKVLVFALVSGLALAGLWRRWQQGLTVWDIAIGLYAILMLIWPEAYWSHRFLIPLIPAYFLYALMGARWVAQLWPRFHNGAGWVVVLLGLIYIARYTQADFGPMRQGMADADTVALFEHIQQATPTEAIFIFQKPRALALYTQRSASAYADNADDATLWQYFRDIGATYVVVAREFKDDVEVLAPFVARQTQGLALVYANADFQLYQIAAPSP